MHNLGFVELFALDFFAVIILSGHSFLFLVIPPSHWAYLAFLQDYAQYEWVWFRYLSYLSPVAGLT